MPWESLMHFVKNQQKWERCGKGREKRRLLLLLLLLLLHLSIITPPREAHAAWSSSRSMSPDLFLSTALNAASSSASDAGRSLLFDLFNVNRAC